MPHLVEGGVVADVVVEVVFLERLERGGGPLIIPRRTKKRLIQGVRAMVALKRSGSVNFVTIQAVAKDPTLVDTVVGSKLSHSCRGMCSTIHVTSPLPIKPLSNAIYNDPRVNPYIPMREFWVSPSEAQRKMNYTKVSDDSNGAILLDETFDPPLIWWFLFLVLIRISGWRRCLRCIPPQF